MQKDINVRVCETDFSPDPHHTIVHLLHGVLIEQLCDREGTADCMTL